MTTTQTPQQARTPFAFADIPMDRHGRINVEDLKAAVEVLAKGAWMALGQTYHGDPVQPGAKAWPTVKDSTPAVHVERRPGTARVMLAPSPEVIRENLAARRGSA